MPRLRQWLLASAITLVTTHAFALEAMDENAMEATTGQDGITIGVTLPSGGLSWGTVIHDAGGYTGATTDGAIVIGKPAGGSYTNTSLSATGEILLTVDATGDVTGGTGSNPAIKINLTLPTGGLTIHTGDISVAKSAGQGVSVTGQTAAILNDMTIALGQGSLLNIYLGNEPTGGHMIDINSTLTGGITISNFSLNDTGGTVNGGSIAATSIKLCNTDTTQNCTATNSLTLQANVDFNGGTTAAGGGMIFTATQIGTASGADVEITGFKLGSTNNIGNIDLVGFNLANTKIRIAGN